MRTKYLGPILLTAAIMRAACAGEAQELWATKVQALFDVQCVKCHGPLEQKSGLELDTPEAVLKGGDEGKVIVPGKPEESRLYQYLAAGADPHMPPKKQLGDADIRLVREWIMALANDGTKKTSDKTVPEFAGISEAVDVLIAEGWKKRGVKPAKALEDRAWVRRIYLDLAGRIPTSSEVAEFLGSKNQAKRAELVDRVITSDE